MTTSRRLMLLLTVCTAVVGACRRDGAESSTPKTGAAGSPAVLVRVTLPRRGSLDARLGFTAEIDAFEKADVFPKTGGVVNKAEMLEGRRVNRGDILAEIENDQQVIDRDIKKLAVEEARVRAEAARKTLAEAEARCGSCDERIVHQRRLYERLKKQRASDIVSDQDVEAAQFNYDQAVSEKKTLSATVAARKTDVAAADLALEVARANLRTAELMLEWTRIRAPLTGTVVKQNLRMGQTAQPSQIAFTIADLDSLVVIPEISQVELRRLRAGLAVDVTASAFPGRHFTGKVEFVAPEVDRTKGTVAVRIRIDRSDPPLLPGMFVSGHIITDSRDDVRLIPKKALSFAGDRPFVYVVEPGEDGVTRVRKTFIVRGLQDAEFVECVRADAPAPPITDDTQIVVVGIDRLADGSIVHIEGAATESDERAEAGAESSGDE